MPPPCAHGLQSTSWVDLMFAGPVTSVDSMFTTHRSGSYLSFSTGWMKVEGVYTSGRQSRQEGVEGTASPLRPQRCTCGGTPSRQACVDVMPDRMAGLHPLGTCNTEAGRPLTSYLYMLSRLCSHKNSQGMYVIMYVCSYLGLVGWAAAWRVVQVRGATGQSSPPLLVSCHRLPLALTYPLRQRTADEGVTGTSPSALPQAFIHALWPPPPLHRLVGPAAASTRMQSPPRHSESGCCCDPGRPHRTPRC